MSFVRFVSGFVSLIKAQSNDFKKCHFSQSKVGNLVSFNLLHQYTQQTSALYIKQIYKLITKLQIYTHKKSFFLFPLARKSKPPYSILSRLSRSASHCPAPLLLHNSAKPCLTIESLWHIGINEESPFSDC